MRPRRRAAKKRNELPPPHAGREDRREPPFDPALPRTGHGAALSGLFYTQGRVFAWAVTGVTGFWLGEGRFPGARMEAHTCPNSGHLASGPDRAAGIERRVPDMLSFEY